MLPDRQQVALVDGDDQGVGQQADDPGALDPADLLDPCAHGGQVDAEQRLVTVDVGGLQDVRFGGARSALQVHGLQAEAGAPELGLDRDRRGRGEPLRPMTGGEGDDQAGG